MKRLMLALIALALSLPAISQDQWQSSEQLEAKRAFILAQWGGIYNSRPGNTSGSTSITTLGTITTGTWNGSVIGPAYGGTGVANNAASTLTISGNFATTLTVSGTTGVTLPTSGTLYAVGGALGTPSSGVATNLTGTAAGLTAGSVTTNANLTGDVTSVGNATTISPTKVGDPNFRGQATAPTVTATGANSLAMGPGASVDTNSASSVSIGNTCPVVANIGKLAFCGGSGSVLGKAVAGAYVLTVSTSGATPADMTSNNAAVSAYNQIQLPNSTTVGVRCTVVARRSDAGTVYAMWTLDFLIVREANAASTALQGAPVAVAVFTQAGSAAWTIVPTADTTNGAAKLTATGTAGQTSRWAANCLTSEITN